VYFFSVAKMAMDAQHHKQREAMQARLESKRAKRTALLLEKKATDMAALAMIHEDVNEKHLTEAEEAGEGGSGERGGAGGGDSVRSADALEATVADALDTVNVDGGHEKVKAEAIEAMEAEQERMKAQIDQQQAQERERLERQTAEEQARLLQEEAAAIQKEAEVGAMAKKAELDERVRAAQNKMHGDEARRVQEKATREFDEYVIDTGGIGWGAGG
jgi:hypothetical protein